MCVKQVQTSHTKVTHKDTTARFVSVKLLGCSVPVSMEEHGRSPKNLGRPATIHVQYML